jgi:alginate O-acetyltransferase complex protein AlgI
VLFNSFTFVFIFLPAVVGGYLVLRRLGGADLRLVWILAASLFFYGWWNPWNLFLLVGSIGFNYGAGLVLAGRVPAISARLGQPVLLTIGVVANLALLGFFKYANFFVDSVGTIFGASIPFGEVVLPLAISFFTLQQIAFLIDVYRGRVANYSFLHYGVFVSFFPQLIAGPIVHHHEVIPQFSKGERGVPLSNISIGLTIFAVGLFKKVILADTASTFATPVFDAALAGADPTLVEAWGGMLAYTLQIYFDFSGYSDMAIGLARMFGIRLPLNFNAPYQSASIIEFWGRWHITLSRFLREYLYIPLGGNRNGNLRRYGNLMAVMLIGGLWHGAGVTFVIWGGLHGLYLIVNHTWRNVAGALGRRRRNPVPSRALALHPALARAITFLAVAFAWVAFRAEDLGSAGAIYRGLFGFNGISLPSQADFLEPLTRLVPIAFDGLGAFGSVGGERKGVIVIAILLVVVAFAPPTHRWLARTRPVLGRISDPSRIQWRPSLRWAIVTGLIASIAVYGMFSGVDEFIYFQF